MLTIEKYPKGNHSILPQIRYPNDGEKPTSGSNLRLATPESGTPAITHKPTAIARVAAHMCTGTLQQTHESHCLRAP